MESPRFSIGVDYGTNSCRAVLVDASNGRELAASVFPYPSGKDGILLDPKDPNVARQEPADYIAGFFFTVKSVVAAGKKIRGFSPERVVGMGVDTTGSTPIPVNREGVALAMLPKFKKDMAAKAWLWKDHTAHAEASRITKVARKAKVPYLSKCGMAYSSEWFWSKIWHCQKTAPAVFKAAWSWVECCDFVTGYITGNSDPLSMKRSICAAGHKAMFHEGWGGLPGKAFLRKLSPALADLRDRLYSTAYASDEIAGNLVADIAKKVGLPAGIPVAVGALDAHYGAVGSGVKPGTLVKILGTSTCDLMVVPNKEKLEDIPGVCGIVPGSVVPGMVGIEAGQSAVGDIFKWYVDYLCPSGFSKGNPHANLNAAALKLKPGQSGLLALDWNNGNRNILMDPLLTGLLVGMTLHTTAPEIYRALVEATAFGALTIIRRIEEHGVKVREVINCGGIAEKSPLVMQIYADILNRPMKIAGSSQTCALGGAIFGSIVGGVYRNVEEAQQKMVRLKPKVYKPIKANVKTYARLYPLYRQLHDAFGTSGYSGMLANVMKELIAIRGGACR
ncbi:MAG: ribulokinase [Planctomycetes bacterium]|nr:ribulokinase [Planctomycetota bacterium]